MSAARVSATSSPGREIAIGADLVVNATGPWSEQVARMAGVDVPIRPSPGVMLALRGRLCNMVVNRLHASGDGDIVVPQRALSVVGTSSWVVDDPDDLGVPDDHVQRMIDEGSMLVPAVRDAEFRAAWSAARPLIGSRDEADSGRELSRTFKTIDHAVDDGVEGFVTITGGKAHDAARHGRGLRRRGLPQARRRAAVRHARDAAAPPHGGVRGMSDPDRTRTGSGASVRAGRRRAAHGGVRRAGRRAAPRSSRPCDGSSCTSTRPSDCGTRASTPPAARAACA